jgi:methylphosphotriester-DNA--protein-cysteine methyltransferase
MWKEVEENQANREHYMSTEQTEAIVKVTTAKLAVRERQKTALELRLSGKTFQAIADELGCSKHTAHRLVEQALDATIKEPAERVREMELHRLDGMFAGFWPQAQQGDAVAAAGCLKVMEHRAKLLGLYAAEPVRGNGEQAIQVVTVAVDGNAI